MGENFYPFLCGGTCFSLICHARKQRSDGRKHFEHDVFAELLKIIAPHPHNAALFKGDAFKGAVSIYKSCSKNQPKSSIYLPFLEVSERKSFDERIKTEYPIWLKKMANFTENFITLNKHVWLAKALFELISEDKTIPDEQEFYAQEDGQPISKPDLVKSESICLPALLLGIWHFIVLRSDRKNECGNFTYETWHQQAEKHSKREFTSDFGKQFQYPKKVSVEICDNKHDEEHKNGLPTEPQTDKGAPVPTIAQSQSPSDTSVGTDNIPPTANVPNPVEEDFDTRSVDANNIKENEEIILSKKTALTKEILDIFTKGVRDYKIADFLIDDDLESVREVSRFVDDMRPKITPYKDDILAILETEDGLFFRRISNFMTCIEALVNAIYVVEPNLRKLTILSKLERLDELEAKEGKKQEEASLWEQIGISVPSSHREATRLFREICIDNNLECSDICNDIADEKDKCLNKSIFDSFRCFDSSSSNSYDYKQTLLLQKFGCRKSV